MVQPDNTEAIRNLQQYLRRISYVQHDIPTVPIDGIYGETTKAAVTAFQIKNGLIPTGTAYRETWDKIYSQYSEINEKYSPPSPFNIFPRLPEGYALSLGDRSFLVNVVQYVLQELSLIRNNFNIPDDTGSYGTETQTAVMDFQRENLLPQTGKVDKATWDRLMLVFNAYGNDYIQ